MDGSKPTVAAATYSAVKPIEQSDASSIPQQNVPQESTLQVDGSKPTVAAATSSAVKPIEQSDASSIPQQNVPQESTLRVDGSKPTDAVATSAAAKPIEQSDASSIPQQNVPQGNARYRSMDLNRPMPPQRLARSRKTYRAEWRLFDSTTKRSARKHATGRWI